MPKKKNFLGGMQNYNPNTGEYESRLVKANGEPATKANMPGGEDEKGKSFKAFKKDKGNDLDNRIEKVIKERIKKGWDSEGTFDVQAVKDTDYYGFGNIDELEKQTFGKKEIKKPTDFEGVEETPYGYIYNVGNTSITDLKAERKSMNMKVDENKEYGYSVFKDGEEVYYPTFEEAYKSAKGKDDTFGKINNARMGIKTKSFDEEFEETKQKLNSLDHQRNKDIIKSINEGKEYKDSEEYISVAKKFNELKKQRTKNREEAARNKMAKLGLKDYSKYLGDNYFDNKGVFKGEGLRHEDRIYAIYQFSLANPSLDFGSLLADDITKNRDKYDDEFMIGNRKFIIGKSGWSYQSKNKTEKGWENVSTGNIPALATQIELAYK